MSSHLFRESHKFRQSHFRLSHIFRRSYFMRWSHIGATFLGGVIILRGVIFIGGGVAVVAFAEIILIYKEKNWILLVTKGFCEILNKKFSKIFSEIFVSSYLRERSVNTCCLIKIFFSSLQLEH